ncbi:MAG: hypothetical protein Q8P49_03665, partial [Candidatus Liptonbacteria bacterium]|nr:hypothetical protein [Candidatus Liptonbacteria bacterium]
MKKLTFLAIGALMLFGFASHTNQAHAADSLAATEVVGTENARVLQQSLNILGATLDQLDKQLDANRPPANPVAAKEDLTAIHGELVSIRSTIASLDVQARALARNSATAPSPVITQAPQPQISDAAPVAEAETQSVASPIPATTERNDAMASATLALNSKKLLWPAILILAVAAGIFFLRRKRAEEPEGGHDD